MDARTLHQVEAELKAAADSTRRDAATHYGQGRRETAASIYRLADGLDTAIEITQGLRDRLDMQAATGPAAGKNWGQVPPVRAPMTTTATPIAWLPANKVPPLREPVEPWTDGPEPTAEMAEVAFEAEVEQPPVAGQVDELTMDVADMAPARERNGIPEQDALDALVEHLQREHEISDELLAQLPDDLDGLEAWHDTDTRRRLRALQRTHPRGTDHGHVGARGRELTRERAAKEVRTS